MAITFRCPACNNLLQVDDDMAGRQVACAQCRAWMTVPASAPAQPAGDGGLYQASPVPAGPLAGQPPALGPQPAYVPPGGWAPLPPVKTSGLAIAALILCLIPFTYPIGAILAIIALITVSRDPTRRGSGLAVGGLLGGAVIPVIAILIAILLPALGQAREMARRGKCAHRLSGFADTLKLYTGNNDDQYPSVAQGRKTDGSRMAVADGVDTMASLWLLVTTKSTATDEFACPSDSGAIAFNDTIEKDTPVFPNVTSTGLRDDHGRLRSWSYSYQIPNGDAGNPGKDNPASSKFAIMADRAPFHADLELLGNEDTPAEAKSFLQHLPKSEKGRYNSPNHGGEGQNVLFQDGHVTWQTHPWCGINDDNIYTWATGKDARDRLRGQKAGSANAVTQGPFDDDDSVLVNILEGVPCKDK